MPANLRRFQPPTTWISAIEWDVQSVRVALRGLMAGNFRMAAALADAMLGDPRIGGDLETRVNAVTSSPLTLEPANRREGRTAARRLQDGEFWELFPEQAVKEAMSYGLLLGVVPVQHLWDTRGDGTRWALRIKPWWPGWLRYDAFRRAYEVETAEGWRLLGVESPAAVTGRDDPEWSLYSPGGYSRPWLGGLVRRLAIPFLLRNYSGRDWGRWSERHGLPTPKAHIPPEADDQDPAYQRFVQSLMDLASEGLVILPQGRDREGRLEKSYDMSYLEAAAQSWQGFERLKIAAEQDISVAILGNHMVSNPQNKEAGVMTALEVKQDRKESDAETLATYLHEGPLYWWAAYNLGNPALAPWPRYQVEPPVDEKQEAETFGLVLSNLERMRAMGYDTADYESRHGLRRAVVPGEEA